MKINYQRILTMTLIALLVASTQLFAAETDASIVSSVKESYVFKTYLKDDAVKTESKEGLVTLSGTVSHPSHKSLAEKTVENLPGVKNVDNRLELKGKSPPEKSNEWLAMNIKAALLFHQNVSVENTQIYVEEGIVTLRGEATSEAQKALTAEYANIEGVQGVRNEMTVAAVPEKVDERTTKEKIDDASITAQVKITLMTHRATSALGTSVATKDGIVTLGGKAQNAAEIDLATKLVGDIHGVNSVINNMAV